MATDRDTENSPLTEPHPRKLEDAALRLAEAAESVNENVMGNGLAFRRDALRYEILAVRALVHDLRAARRAG